MAAWRCIPSLLARDLEETIAFYQALGFALAARHPDGPSASWVELQRDGFVLQFYAEPPVGTPTRPLFSGTLYVAMDDVAALAEELRGKVSFAWGPEVMDYGQLEFAVTDPNGYLLAFCEPD